MIRGPISIDPSLLSAWALVSADTECKKNILKTKMESFVDMPSKINAEEKESVTTEKPSPLQNNFGSKISITDLVGKFENKHVTNRSSLKKKEKKFRCPERSSTVIGIGNSLLFNKPISLRNRTNSCSCPDVTEVEPKVSVKELLKRFEESSAHLVKDFKKDSVSNRNYTEIDKATLQIPLTKSAHISPAPCCQETSSMIDKGKEPIGIADAAHSAINIFDTESADKITDKDLIIYEATVVLSEDNMFSEQDGIKDDISCIYSTADASKDMEHLFGESEKNRIYPLITDHHNVEVDNIETSSVSVKNMRKKFETMSNSEISIIETSEESKILHTPYFAVERKLSIISPNPHVCITDMLPNSGYTADFENSISFRPSSSDIDEFENVSCNDDDINLTKPNIENMNETVNECIISDKNVIDRRAHSMLPSETLKEDMNKNCKTGYDMNIGLKNNVNLPHIKEFSYVNNCQKFNKKFIEVSQTDEENESSASNLLNPNAETPTLVKCLKPISPILNKRTKLFGEPVLPKTRLLKEDEANYFKNYNSSSNFNNFPRTKETFEHEFENGNEIENEIINVVQHKKLYENDHTHEEVPTEIPVRSSSIRLPKNCRALKEEEKKFFTLGNATDLFFQRDNIFSSKLSKNRNIPSADSVFSCITPSEDESSIIRNHDANKDLDNISVTVSTVENEFDNAEQKYSTLFEDSSLLSVTSNPIDILDNSFEENSLYTVDGSPLVILSKENSPNRNFSPLLSPSFEITYSKDSIDIEMENTMENINILDHSFDQLFDENGLIFDYRNIFHSDDTEPLASAALVKKIYSIYNDVEGIDSYFNNAENNQSCPVSDEDSNIKLHDYEFADVSTAVHYPSNDQLKPDMYEIKFAKLDLEIDSKIKFIDENGEKSVENYIFSDEVLNTDPYPISNSSKTISDVSIVVDSPYNSDDQLNSDTCDADSYNLHVETATKIELTEENGVTNMENTCLLNEDLNTEPYHDISISSQTVDSSAILKENIELNFKENYYPVINVESYSKNSESKDNIVTECVKASLGEFNKVENSQVLETSKTVPSDKESHLFVTDTAKHSCGGNTLLDENLLFVTDTAKHSCGGNTLLDENLLFVTDTAKHSCGGNTLLDEKLYSSSNLMSDNVGFPREVTGQVNRSINFFQNEMHGEQVPPVFNKHTHDENYLSSKSESAEPDQSFSNNIDICHSSNYEEISFNDMSEKKLERYCPIELKINPIFNNENLEDRSIISSKPEINPQENIVILRKKKSMHEVKKNGSLVDCPEQTECTNRFFYMVPLGVIILLMFLIIAAYILNLLRT